MSRNYEKWKCSCGTENYFRHRKCRECSKPMPRSVRSAVFRSELRRITQSISDQIRAVHNAFWQKLKRPLVRVGIALRLLSFILIALFVVMLFQHSNDIRLDAIVDKSQLKLECIVDNVSKSQLKLERIVDNACKSQLKLERIADNVSKSQLMLEHIADNACKSQLKLEHIVDNVPTLVPNAEWKKVLADISSKFKSWRGTSNIIEKFEDVEDVFNDKIKEIESKKDRVLDYVN